MAVWHSFGASIINSCGRMRCRAATLTCEWNSATCTRLKAKSNARWSSASRRPAQYLNFISGCLHSLRCQKRDSTRRITFIPARNQKRQHIPIFILAKKLSHMNTSSSNNSRRRPTSATGLCLVGLALNACLSSAHRHSEKPAHRSLQEDKAVLGKGPTTFYDQPTSSNPTNNDSEAETAVTTEQIEQIKQIMVDFTLGAERGHLKDPDLLNGDNPGW